MRWRKNYPPKHDTLFSLFYFLKTRKYEVRKLTEPYITKITATAPTAPNHTETEYVVVDQTRKTLVWVAYHYTDTLACVGIATSDHFEYVDYAARGLIHKRLLQLEKLGYTVQMEEVQSLPRKKSIL